MVKRKKVIIILAILLLIPLVAKYAPRNLSLSSSEVTRVNMLIFDGGKFYDFTDEETKKLVEYLSTCTIRKPLFNEIFIDNRQGRTGYIDIAGTGITIELGELTYLTIHNEEYLFIDEELVKGDIENLITLINY